jgi:serine/threonine-protein kinase
MAERVIGATEVLGEAWLARAMARLELGDPGGAVTDLARAGRVMPGYAPVHAARGRLLLEGGATARAKRHLARAIALEPSLSAPRLDAALGAGQAGDFVVAHALVDELLDRRHDAGDAWVLAARLALWSHDAERARALRIKLARRSLERQERAAYLLDAALGGDSAEALDYFAWLAEGDPAAARRSAAARQLEAELAAVGGDLARAIDALDIAASTPGFSDIAWLDGCPLLEPLRASPRFVGLRRTVEATSRGLLEILDATREERES